MNHTNLSSEFRSLRRRKAAMDYSEEEYNGFVMEEDEESLVYDCCFIKVTGSIYQRWKRARELMDFQNDEDLAIHLLDNFQNDKR